MWEGAMQKHKCQKVSAIRGRLGDWRLRKVRREGGGAVEGTIKREQYHRCVFVNPRCVRFTIFPSIFRTNFLGVKLIKVT